MDEHIPARENIKTHIIRTKINSIFLVLF